MLATKEHQTISHDRNYTMSERGQEKWWIWYLQKKKQPQTEN